jgi:hypothetical protein
VKTADEAAKAAADADAVLGFASAEILKAGPKLRWVHAGTGAAMDVAQDLPGAGTVLTVARRRADPVNPAGPPGEDWAWRLLRENVRRFVAGEPLLGAVRRAKGD